MLQTSIYRAAHAASTRETFPFGCSWTLLTASFLFHFLLFSYKLTNVFSCY